MRLVNVSNDQAPKPYAIFEEIKGTKFSDFDIVRQKIIELTDKVAGTTKNIVNIPIVLTIYSSTGPDLTLVDLPGITRIPLHNSGQPENIEEITKNMALAYVKEPRTIILAVVPANADLSTSDALKMAKEIDPTGTRTLGVLTKIDIMDKGTSAKRILLNQEIQLKLGNLIIKGTLV
jgi:replication fork clamp-binding protein CrfC